VSVTKKGRVTEVLITYYDEEGQDRWVVYDVVTTR